MREDGDIGGVREFSGGGTRLRLSADNTRLINQLLFAQNNNCVLLTAVCIVEHINLFLIVII